MDQETGEFIKSQMKSQLEEITGVIRDMGMAMEVRLGKAEAGLRDEIKGIRDDMETMRQAMRDELHTAEDTLWRELKQGQGKLMEEIREQRDIILRMEYAVSDRGANQGAELRNTRQRVERIENHFNFPLSLSAAA